MEVLHELIERRVKVLLEEIVQMIHVFQLEQKFLWQMELRRILKM
jgi:hypothetical protein